MGSEMCIRDRSEQALDTYRDRHCKTSVDSAIERYQINTMSNACPIRFFGTGKEQTSTCTVTVTIETGNVKRALTLCLSSKTLIQAGAVTARPEPFASHRTFLFFVNVALRFGLLLCHDK